MRSKHTALFAGALAATLAFAELAHAIIGMPLTPFSVAGVARRTVRRTAYIGAAAGAYGGYGGYGYGAPAAVPVMPAGCVVGAPCGGAVYQPVYQGTNIMYAPQ